MPDLTGFLNLKTFGPKNYMHESHMTYTLEYQKWRGRRWALGFVYQIGNYSISGGSLNESALSMELECS